MTEEDKISVIEFEGCDYLGEVNEDMQPNGRGVLKSKDNFATTNGWWKNGLLHGEATISKGYNKENEDEKLKEQRKGCSAWLVGWEDNHLSKEYKRRKELLK